MSEGSTDAAGKGWVAFIWNCNELCYYHVNEAVEKLSYQSAEEHVTESD